MAWCQEFAIQIAGGCDQLMVAGHDRCACPDCGVVCRGKFAGCATVWAAGPVQVTLRHEAKVLGTRRALGKPSPPNGKATGVSHLYPPPIPLAPTPAEPPGELAALVQSMQSEIGDLNARLDHLLDRAEASDESAIAAFQAVDDLPEQLGRALGAALQQQHDAFSQDLADLREQLAADLGQLSDRGRPRSDAELQAAIVDHLDARLEWLVKELSDRLVFLGNEVVRLSTRLDVAQPDQPADNWARNQIAKR